MTDEEYWLRTEHVDVLLRVLSGRGSDRKLRLFTCGCCSDAAKLLNERELQAVAVAERFTDGRATNIERAEAICSLVAELGGSTVEHSRHGLPYGYSVTYHRRSLLPVLALMTDDEYLINAESGRPIVGLKQSREFAYERARLAANWAATMLAHEQQEASRGIRDRVYEFVFRYTSRLLDGSWPVGVVLEGRFFTNYNQMQLARLRDIFGNPFRPVSFDRVWLTADVLALARGIYEDRAFDRMPILADALQDSGCANEDILNHCRDTSLMHVRGCWVVDLLLGKQ